MVVRITVKVKVIITVRGKNEIATGMRHYRERERPNEGDLVDTWIKTEIQGSMEGLKWTERSKINS